MGKMTKISQKEFFTPLKSMFFLLGIVVLACAAHVNFFLKDARPFIDHDWDYFSSGHLAPVTVMYKFLMFLSAEFFPKMHVSGFFIYKICNLIMLIPSIVFMYLGASFLYSRFIGLVAAFLFISQPEILNVFHKSGVNIVTVFLFSAMVFAYIRSDFFRNFEFSLLSVLAAILLFLHHHSSLLYLSVTVSVFVISSYGKARSNQRIKRNIKICLAAGLVFVAGDLVVNFLRYREYFKTASDYFNAGFNISSVSLSDSLLSFVGRSAFNFWQMYNYYQFHFNFYGILTLAGLLFYCCRFICCLKRKDTIDFVSLSEFQFFLISVIIMMVLSTGICHTAIFITPVYVLLIILNAGLVFRIQNRYGAFWRGKVFIFLFSGFGFLYGCFSLFYPHKLVEAQVKDMMYYLPCKDDLNILAVRDFYTDRKNGITNFALVPATPYDEATVDLIDFYFSIEIGPEAKHFSDTYDYLLVLYDLYKYENPHRKIFLPDLEEKARRHLAGLIKDKQLFLEKVVPFRWLTHQKHIFFGFSGHKEEVCKRYSGFSQIKDLYSDSYKGTKEDLLPERSCLLFVYTLK